jgi:hypothetical protein
MKGHFDDKRGMEDKLSWHQQRRKVGRIIINDQRKRKYAVCLAAPL